MAQLFGKNYQETGSSSSPLLLRSNGEIKLQWGNKFIDLIKNGKVVSSNTEVITQVSSTDEMTKTGIYYNTTDSSYYASINGTATALSDSGTTYVSFMAEQETTANQKYQALSNIGFYYKTLDAANSAGLTAGIIYNEADNKLYIIKEGVLSEYSPNTENSSAGSTNTEGTNSNNFEELYIADMHIYSDGYMHIDTTKTTWYIDNNNVLVLDKSSINVNTNIRFSSDLFSQNYSSNSSGWGIYYSSNKTVLEVDSINWRNIDKELPSIESILDKSTIYSSTNIIKSCFQDGDNITANLKYNMNFKVGDQIAVYINLSKYNYLVITTDTKLQINQAVPTNYTLQVTTSTGTYSFSGSSTSITGSGTLVSAVMLNADSIEDSKYNIALASNKTFQKDAYITTISTVDLDNNTITFSVENYQSEFEENCYNTKVSLYGQPLIYQTNNYFSLIDWSSEQAEVHTKIGEITNDDFIKLSADWEEDSETLEDIIYPEVGIYSDKFIGLNSQLYNPLFKKGQRYPRYDKELTLPESNIQNKKFDNVVPSLAWVKQLIDYFMPIGSIIAWHGTEIPEGWSICDGSNSTPNLIGKFIKAGVSEETNETDLDENNQLQLEEKHLPKHSHPHKKHKHTISGTGTDSVSHNTYSAYATSAGAVGEDGSVSVLGGISKGSSSESVSISGSSFTISEETSEEETKTWTNEKIKVEPHAYSLVFIMKYKNLFNDNGQ